MPGYRREIIEVEAIEVGVHTDIPRRTQVVACRDMAGEAIDVETTEVGVHRSREYRSRGPCRYPAADTSI